MNETAAIDLAQDVLIWLSGRPDDLGELMAASGADAADLRARATDPVFLGFVLDFVLGTDDRVLAFAREAGRAPELVLRARAALPGGNLPNWT